MSQLICPKPENDSFSRWISGLEQALSSQRQHTVSQPPNICTSQRPATHRVSTFLLQILLKMYFHSWICTYCAVTMAAGFSINRFQLSIKYMSWMVGIVPLVSQTATAGGEAGVGVHVAVLGRGAGRCDTAELQWCEVLEIQQRSQWSSTAFYSEAHNVRSPNIIMENNNNHSLVCRTNWRAAPVWSHCGDES